MAKHQLTVTEMTNGVAGQARSEAEPATGRGDPATSGLVTVRYFAAARAAAGTTEEHLSVDGPLSLDDLAGRLARRHGPGLARVLDAASFLVDATAGPRTRIVQVGVVVDVLPPFAGG